MDLIEQAISCPYCGETISVFLDSPDVGDRYIEDCQVCCRPIVFHIQMDATGDFVAHVHTEDDVF